MLPHNGSLVLPHDCAAREVVNVAALLEARSLPVITPALSNLTEAHFVKVPADDLTIASTRTDLIVAVPGTAKLKPWAFR